MLINTRARYIKLKYQTKHFLNNNFLINVKFILETVNDV